MTSIRQPSTTCLVAILLTTLAFAPGGAAAQGKPQTAVPVVITAGPSRSDIELAERLEAQAEGDVRLTRKWREAATLRLRAARLRRETPEAIGGYQRAAWLFSASGDHGMGRQVLEQGARVALDRGDPARAIGMLVDATLMANADGDPRQTIRLLQRTRSLVETANLPETRRLALRARVDSAAHVASR